MYRLHDTVDQELPILCMGCDPLVSANVDSVCARADEDVRSILWVALFGIFGKLYIKKNAHHDSSVQNMKNAVWVDLINMLLWLLSAAYGAVLFFKHRSHKSLFTGRADV